MRNLDKTENEILQKMTRAIEAHENGWLAKELRPFAKQLADAERDLAAAIELAEELLPYVDEYFQEKWDYPKQVADLRKKEKTNV